MDRFLPLLLLPLAVACDPCAGTPSCNTQPELSYTGQVIEFPSGKAVSGVRVTFAAVPEEGLVTDTISALSDDAGMFVLRGGAYAEGAYTGNLIITPPPPRAAYTVRSVVLSAHRRRGDGGFLGRMMVNPYLQFIGELRDRKTLEPVPNARIVIRQYGPGKVAPDSTVVTSAENGRIMWEPTVTTFDNLETEFEITANGYPRSYHLRDTLALQYLDEPPRFRLLIVGGGWSYAGQVMRRGTRQFLSGVSVEFRRVSGIQARPDHFVATPNSNGIFGIPMEPVGEGTMFADLIIKPPAPLQPDTVRNLKLTTFDGGGTRLLGPLGYGAGAIARPVLLYRATGKPVKKGTWARFTHVGGIATIYPAQWTNPDSGIRIVDSSGTVGYDVGTLDSGKVVYDIEVRLNLPNAWDTLKTVSIPSRFSDVPVIDTFRVGSWFPWSGEVRDQASGAPVPNASIEFRRTAGAQVNPATFTTTSLGDGTFLLRPVPVTAGAVDAQLTVRTSGAFRDTTFAVHLTPAQNDTPRSIGVILLKKGP